MPEKQINPNTGLRKLGYASAVIGGGVVGVDYATWWDIEPAFGAVIGSVIGSLLTKILYYLQDDPERQILEFLVKAGIFFGAIAGAYVGYIVGVSESQMFGLMYAGFGLFGGVITGAFIGRLVSGLVSLSAFTLLFISRGPVGAFLRQMAGQSSAGEALNSGSPSEALFSESLVSVAELLGSFMS